LHIETKGSEFKVEVPEIDEQPDQLIAVKIKVQLVQHDTSYGVKQKEFIVNFI
jgi:hypothetical protein